MFKSISYPNNKAKNWLIWPNAGHTDFKDVGAARGIPNLKKLPGVGRKTPM